MVIKTNKKSKYLILLLFILLNLLLKIVILFNSNQLSDPGLDECYLVNFAKGMLLGEEKLSILYYFMPEDIVLCLFTGILLTMSFMVFGISGYALKIIPILTSTAIVSLAYLFLYKFFNKKTAIITSLLFIFAPFAYTMRTLIIYEDYKGSMILAFLIMYIFFNIFYNNKKSYWNFILLGLVSGFALSFSLTNFAIILTFMFFWLSFDKKFFIKKNFLIFLAAFLIVLSPLMVYNYAHNFSSFELLDYYFKVDNKLITYKSNLPIYDNLISLVAKDIPSSFNFNDVGFMKGIFLNYAYYFIFIIAFVFIFYKNRISFLNFFKNIFLLKKGERISKEIFIIAYPILYASIYLFLGVDAYAYFHYTHLLPLYPFIFISIGLFTTHLYQKKNLRVFSIFLIAFVLLLGLKCNLDLLSFNDEEKIDYLAACEKDRFTSGGHHRWIILYLGDINLAKKECQKLDKGEWRACYEDISKSIPTTYLIGKNVSKTIDECLLVGANSGGCIMQVAIYAGGERNAPKTCEEFPREEYKKTCYSNFGVAIALDNKDDIEECKKVGDEYFNDCKKGFLAQKYKVG